MTDPTDSSSAEEPAVAASEPSDKDLARERAETSFPRHWVADVLTSDGGVVHLRPIVPSDSERIVAFHGRLSERTRYLRYFGPYPTMPQRDVLNFTTVDHHDRVAFVAVLGDDIIAVGRYERLPEATVIPPRWPSSSPTRIRAAGWVRSCSNTSRERPPRTG